MLPPAALAPRTVPGRLVLGLCAALFLAERLAEALGIAPAWTAGSLDDLVCMPLVLSLVTAAQRLGGRAPAWRLPPAHGLAITAAYALFFEGLLPRWDARATGDPRDVLAYAAGCALFHLVVNRPARRARPPRTSGACAPPPAG